MGQTGLFAAANVVLFAASVAVLCAVVAAVWFESYVRRAARVEPIRPASALTLLVMMGCTGILPVLQVHPLRGLPQSVIFVIVPYLVCLAGAVRFPEGVPPRDQACTIAFFVFVTAATIHSATMLWDAHWWTDGVVGDDHALRVVRRCTMLLSTVAVAGHALAIAVHRCRRLWAYSRTAFAFAGGLRLASAAALRICAGAPASAPIYPPSNLDLWSSVLVNSSYVLLALLCTRPNRRAVSHTVLRLLGVGSKRRAIGSVDRNTAADIDAPVQATPSTTTACASGRDAKGEPTRSPRDRSEQDAPAEGSSHSSVCTICMAGPSDHALILCGHICVCAGCAERVVVQDGRCPVCRATAYAYLKVYHT